MGLQGSEQVREGGLPRLVGLRVRTADRGVGGVGVQVQATLEKAGVVSFAQLLDLGGPEAKPLEILEHVKM